MTLFKGKTAMKTIKVVIEEAVEVITWELQLLVQLKLPGILM